MRITGPDTVGGQKAFNSYGNYVCSMFRPEIPAALRDSFFNCVFVRACAESGCERHPREAAVEAGRYVYESSDDHYRGCDRAVHRRTVGAWRKKYGQLFTLYVNYDIT